MSAIASWQLVPATPGPARRDRPRLGAALDGRPCRCAVAGAVAVADTGSDRAQPAALPTAGLRPTRAGRLLLTVVALALLVAVPMTRLGAPAGATGPERSVTVQAGQTLSEIALVELPQLSIAEGVAQLQLANDLSTTQIRAGQRLVIPTGR